jgi:hypothetical protein
LKNNPNAKINKKISVRALIIMASPQAIIRNAYTPKQFTHLRICVLD